MKMKAAFITRTPFTFALIILMGLFAPDVNAAFTGAFDELLSELQTRATVLAGGTDKSEQKQFKTINKVVKTINRPADSLADDLKTAATVSKTLQKSFPSEFPVNITAGAIGAGNTLPGLLTGIFASLRSEVDDLLAELIAEADDLPEGSAKTKTQAAIANAQASLLEAGAADDFTPRAKALVTALKALGAGFKAVASRTNSGGGGSGGQFMKADIGGSKFSATRFGAINSPRFAIQGERNIGKSADNYDNQFIQLELFNFRGTGTYIFTRTATSQGGAFYFHASNIVGSGENWRTDLDAPGGGTMDVDSYNSATGEIRGSFDLTVVNGDDNRVLRITGTFLIRDDALKGLD